MGRKPALRRYMSVSLPVELVESITRMVNEDPERTYTSIPDFIKDSVRRRVEEMKKQIASQRLPLPTDSRAAGLKPKFCHKCGAELRGPFCSSCGTKN